MPARGTGVTGRLRDAIEDSELSQAELGRRLHRSRSTLSEWKSGRSEPDLATFARLCQELGRSADEVLGLRPREVPTPREVRLVAGLVRAALSVLGRYTADGDADLEDRILEVLSSPAARTEAG